MTCPSVLALRAFAEAEGPLESPLSPEALAEHVKSCERCTRVVALAKKEEQALSNLTPALPAGTARGLARTLAALDTADDASAPPLLPRILLALLGSIAVAGVLLFMVRPTVSPEDPASPREDARPLTPPTPPRVTPKPPAPPVPPIPSPSPQETPDETPPAENPPAPPVPADEPLTRVDPTPPPGEKRPEPTTSRTLAFARGGKLTIGGRTLAPGESLPEGVSVAVGIACAEVESVGSATIVLAPRSSFAVSAGEHGEPVFSLESGKVFARSSGSPYAIATRDGRATPSGTAFVVAIESGATRVTTLEGSVRLDGTDASSTAVVVRPGFSAGLARGKGVEIPKPATPALDWIPVARRPKKLPAAPRIVKAVSFNEALATLSRGQLVPPSRTEPGFARGGGDGKESMVSLWGTRLLDLEPEIWMEVVCKVDRKAPVTLMIWDDQIQENFAVEKALEPGRWTLVAAPLRDFGDKAKLARLIQSGHTTHQINVYTTGGVELLVRDMRFSLEEK